MGVWLRRLGVLAVLGFPMAVLGTRLGLFDFRFGFQIVTWTVYLSVAVFVVGLVLSFWWRKSDIDSAKACRFAALLALIPLLGIGSQLITARSVPAIHNISTDMSDPPQFDKVVALRGENSNPHDYDIQKLASVQAEAYPHIKTKLTSLSANEAFTRAQALVPELGWELVSANSEAGLIEATETTALWGFKDDVVIRITESGEQSAIDLRSVSRVGQSDLGANANRIAKFLDAFDQ